MAGLQNLIAQIKGMQLSDYLDILLVAYIIYSLLPLIRTPKTMRIARAVLVLLVVAWATGEMNLHTINYILNQVLAVGVLAVVILFWSKMFPFQFKDKGSPVIKKETFSIWFKVVVACIPGAVVTLLFDDYIEAHLHTPTVIAAALIIYGAAFIAIESWNKKRTPRIGGLNDISYATALAIGMFQVLSIIPGTSRSGATILGALIIGVSRTAAAEFTFFLAVPVMLGLSAIKLLKFGLALLPLSL